MSFLTLLDGYLAEATWLSPEFRLATGLISLATIVDRRIYVRHSVWKYHPNLYVLLVGDSNSGKSTAINNMTANIVGTVREDLLLTPDFTAEGLLTELSSLDLPRGLVCQEELASIISKKEYMSGIGDVLVKLSNPETKEAGKRLASKKYTVSQPYLNVMIGVQPANISTVFHRDDITSGFVPRLLTMYPKSVEMDLNKDYEDNDSGLQPAIKELKAIDKALGERKVIRRIPITKSASNLIMQFSKEFKTAEALQAPSASICFNRVGELIFKLALLYYVDTEHDKGTLMELSDTPPIDSVDSYNTTNTINSINSNDSINSKDSKGKNERLEGGLGALGIDGINETMESMSDGHLTSAHSSGISNYNPITDEHVLKAIKVIEMLTSGVEEFSIHVSGNPEHLLINNVNNTIKRIGESGGFMTHDGITYVRKSELLRASGMNVQTFDKYIKTIIAREELGPEEGIVTTPGKRPTLVYKILDGMKEV